MICIDHLRRETKPRDTRNIMGTGTSVLLLPAAIDERLNVHVLIDIQEPDTLRTMNLMPRNRQHIDILLLRPNGQLSIGLNRIRMHIRFRINRLHELPDLLNRLNCAHLVVHLHDRHKNRILPDCLPKILETDVPLTVDRQKCHFEPELLLKHLKRPVHRGMLHLRCDDMLSKPVSRKRRPENGCIVRLRTARCEYDLPRLHLQRLRDLLPRCPEILLCIEPLLVLRARIP